MRKITMILIVLAVCAGCAGNPPPSTSNGGANKGSPQDREASQRYIDRQQQRAEENAVSAGFIKIGP